ncbi:MAG: UDP-3-O-acyl-N-acetylglucosamine deacetylase [Gemmatimonadaceae bacterium]
MSDNRATIARPVTLDGIGLHLGQPCRLTFRPAPSGTGRVFVRTDLHGSPATPAHVDGAVFAERRTQLGEGDAALHTVEHVLAAVAAEELDDLFIELDASEPPVLDGSSLPFVEALRSAGREEWPEPAPVLVIDEPLRLEDGVSVYEARPADGLFLEVVIEFPHPLIGRQELRLEVTRDSFAHELAAARTFGFVHEVAALQEKGLIRGATTDNAVVVGPGGIVSNVLRWPDEFVRHKALDCVGDLALAGARVRAHVFAERPSHSGTVRFVRELLARAAPSVHAI